jgi:hypothetical protein
VTGSFRLDELVLRLPGVPPADARRIGEAVARRVAERLAERHASADVGALELRLRLPAGTPDDRMVDEIAGAVLARLTGAP